MAYPNPHTTSWVEGQQARLTGPIMLNGKDLTIEQLVAIAQDCYPFELDERRRLAVANSQDTLVRALYKQGSVYGMNTSYGANATSQNEDTNSGDLLQGLLVGILPLHSSPRVWSSGSDDHLDDGSASSISLSHALPTVIVRSTMVLRVNNFLRAYSGVEWKLIQALEKLLQSKLTPIVPSQGSISASGDLSPLAYIAYALAGHPAIKVQRGIGLKKEEMTAKDALESIGMEPLESKPRQVLGLINGTSVSAAMAAHAHYQAESLLLLTQALTAMATEAMLGFKGAFDAVLHEDTRAHPGSQRVAYTLRCWLAESNLLQDNINLDETSSPVIVILSAAIDPEYLPLALARTLAQKDNGFSLKQDRYSIRTAPQWIGPVVEDFFSARCKLETEMNSVTDNPIFAPLDDKAIHGGNFQATSVTNATEKTRDGLSYLGRLLFSQQSELLNVSMSNGLEPCLAPFEGPSKGGGLKGIDIANAAYTSELAFLANRMGHFNQSAEMANQCINSVALISARYTMQAVETMTKLTANAIYTGLQAIDLRLNLCHTARRIYNDFLVVILLVPSEEAKQAAILLLHMILSSMMRNSRYDLNQRIKLTVEEVMRDYRGPLSAPQGSEPEKVHFWHYLMTADFIGAEKVDEKLIGTAKTEAQFQQYLEHMFDPKTVMTHQDRINYLERADVLFPSAHLRPCTATLRIYRFIRNELDVPMYNPQTLKDRKRCVGNDLAKIYKAIQDGSFRSLLASLFDWTRDGQTVHVSEGSSHVEEDHSNEGGNENGGGDW